MFGSEICRTATTILTDAARDNVKVRWPTVRFQLTVFFGNGGGTTSIIT